MNNGQQSGAMSKAKGSIAVSIFGILLILFGYLGVNNSPLDKIGDNGVIVYAEDEDSPTYHFALQNA